MSDNLFTPNTEILNIDGIFNDNSILFARFGTQDYYMFITGKSFAFWTMINGLRSVTPLFSSDKAVIEAWNESQAEFIEHLGGCKDCQCDEGTQNPERHWSE